MTIDKQDNRRSTREVQQLRKKSEPKGVSVKDLTSVNAFPSKIVFHRLPPSWTEEIFIEHIAPVPVYDYIYFVPADPSYGQYAFSHAYINIVNNHDVAVCLEKFDGYVFLDERGYEYPASVEFATFSKVPKKRSRKADPRKGTIETDADYLKFVESLQNADHEVIPAPETFLEEIEQREKLLKENVPVTTPLIEFMIRRKEERKLAIIQAREDKRKKELERRKREEESRKQKEKERQRDKQRLRDAEEREKLASVPVKLLLKNPEREKVENEKGKVVHGDSNIRTDGRHLSKDTCSRDEEKDKCKTTGQRDKQLLRPQHTDYRSHSKTDIVARPLSVSADDETTAVVTNKLLLPHNESVDKRCSASSAAKSRTQGRQSGRERKDVNEHGKTVLKYGQSDKVGQTKDDSTARQLDTDSKHYARDFKADRHGHHRDSQHREGKVVKEIKGKKDQESSSPDMRDFSHNKDGREDQDVRSVTGQRGNVREKLKVKPEITSKNDEQTEFSDDVDSIGKLATKRMETVESTSGRQRIRYKDRPERAIYNPARRAVERSKDVPSSSAQPNV